MSQSVKKAVTQKQPAQTKAKKEAVPEEKSDEKQANYISRNT